MSKTSSSNQTPEPERISNLIILPKIDTIEDWRKYCRQLETSHRRELRNANRQLETAFRRIEKLEEENAVLLPPKRDNRAIANLNTDYLIPLHRAGERKRVKGILPRVVVETPHPYVYSIAYSYDPSEVRRQLGLLRAFIKRVETEKGGLRGEERVLNKGMLFAFSTVLGYFNFFRYLVVVDRFKGNKDNLFLSKLCNLAIPQVELQDKLYEYDVITWLSEHMPNIGDIPDSPCSVLVTNAYTHSHNREISEAIIRLEQTKLLSFRQSLYTVVSSLAPLAEEEIWVDLLGEVLETSKLTEKSKQIETSRQVASNVPVAQVIIDEHARGGHIYTLEITDPRLAQPVQLKIAVDNDGNLVDPDKEGE